MISISPSRSFEKIGVRPLDDHQYSPWVGLGRLLFQFPRKGEGVSFRQVMETAALAIGPTIKSRKADPYRL